MAFSLSCFVTKPRERAIKHKQTIDSVRFSAILQLNLLLLLPRCWFSSTTRNEKYFPLSLCSSRTMPLKLSPFNCSDLHSSVKHVKNTSQFKCKWLTWNPLKLSCKFLLPASTYTSRWVEETVAKSDKKEKTFRGNKKAFEGSIHREGKKATTKKGDRGRRRWRRALRFSRKNKQAARGGNFPFELEHLPKFSSKAKLKKYREAQDESPGPK